MKKFIILLFAISVLFACNSGGSKTDTKDNTSTDKKDDAADLSKNPDYQKGLDLIAKSDCLTCHKPVGDERIQGPTYSEVANKYAGLPDTIIGHLADKIIKGGNGVWVTEFTMSPHPSLSKEDAEAMVKYILLLKK